MDMKQCRNKSSGDENSEIAHPKMDFSHIDASEHEIDLVRDVIVFAIDAAAKAYGFSGKDLTGESSQHKTDMQEHDVWRRARITAFFALKKAVQIRFTTIAGALFLDRVSGGDLAHFVHDCYLPLYHSDSEFRATTDSIVRQVSDYANSRQLPDMDR